MFFVHCGAGRVGRKNNNNNNKGEKYPPEEGICNQFVQRTFEASRKCAIGGNSNNNCLSLSISCPFHTIETLPGNSNKVKKSITIRPSLLQPLSARVRTRHDNNRHKGVNTQKGSQNTLSASYMGRSESFFAPR